MPSCLFFTVFIIIKHLIYPVKVTAKKGNKKVSKTLTAKASVINAGLRFTTAPAEIAARDEVKFVAKKCPSVAKVTFSSSDATVATVDATTGVVKALKAGDVTITATSDYGKTTKKTVKVVPATPVVESATAKNATTITLTGKNLDLLTINDVKVAGYTATTVKATEDGKTAEITLGSALIPDKDTVVTVTINGTAKEYTVKYSIAATAVAVKDATYKTGATNQYLTVVANGTDTSLNELIANGYDVTFYAYKEDTNGTLQTNTDLLDATPAAFSNTSGKIKDNLSASEVGTYKVKVVLVKGGVTTTSEYATIKVTDKKAYETAFKSLKLQDAATASSYVYDVANDAVSARFGDDLVLTKVVTTNSYGSDDPIADVTKVIITSDNNAVATVAGQKITAQKPGTAKITFTYGSLTKEITLTVKSDVRKFASVKVDPKAPATVLQGAEVQAPIYAVDNYGAYMVGKEVYVNLSSQNTAVDTGKYDVKATKSAAGFTPAGIAAQTVQTGTDGCVYLEFKATDNASAQATFQIYEGAVTPANTKKGSLLTTYHVTTAAKTATNYKLDVVKAVNYSADGNIDYNPVVGDGKIKLELNKYYGTLKDSNIADMTTDTTAKDWTISYDNSIVNVTDGAAGTPNAIPTGSKLSAATATLANLEVTPTAKAGTTTITLKDATQQVKASFTVTTVNTVPGVKDIKLSTSAINYDVVTTVDYRNLFSIVTNVDNPELQGVTLTNNVKNYNKVKLATNVTNLTGYKKDSGVWKANTALTAGDVYVETDGGNLCIGSLQYKLTVGGTYTAVTSTLNIPVNTSTSIIFGMVDADGTTVMNVLDSSVAVNNYSK